MTGLFSPLQIRDLTLTNRAVVSPMLMYQAENGFINDFHITNLGQYAATGLGLVMMESTKIDPHGCSTLKDAGIWDDCFIPGLRKIVDHVHSFGAPVGLQLGHSGRKAGMVLPWEGRGVLDLDQCLTPAGEEWRLVGPSAIAHSDAYKIPHELSLAEITDLVDAFVAATRRAEVAGFDVIELHFAHGYLGHQFVSPHANQRKDSYGGSLNNRMRFPLEVAEAVRQVWPDHKPLFARLSCVDGLGWEIEDSVALAQNLHRRGVDVIDCSTGGLSTGAENLKPGYGYQLPYAAAIAAAGVPAMAVGMISDPHQADAIIGRGKASLTALGRALLYNPRWLYHAAATLGEDLPESLLPRSYGYWLEKRPDLRLGPYPGLARDAQLSI